MNGALTLIPDGDYVYKAYGMGVDSTATLMRWILDPSSRTFPLERLIVTTAQTGNEFRDTADLVTKYMFPMLADAGVRTIQVARASASQSDGITVLDDSRAPTECHIAGDYTLADEMLGNGTVPQSGGARLCSAKAKGWPLDQLIGGLTKGRPYWHAMGFELNEMGRVDRDRPLGVANRRPWYPLVEWGWDRTACEQYIYDVTGIWWPKSCCTYCPFSLANREGRERTIRRYLVNPDEAMLGLLMEYVAVALNPRQGLVGGRQLLHLLQRDPRCAGLLERFYDYLDNRYWAVYEVQRAYRARANAVRSVRRLATGYREDMLKTLGRLGVLLGGSIDSLGSPGGPVEVDGWHHRTWLTRRADDYPCTEHLLVAAPATVADKMGPGFDKAWQAAIARGPQAPSLADHHKLVMSGDLRPLATVR